MSNYRIASRYAHALYLKAVEGGHDEAVAGDMKTLVSLSHSNREFRAFLNSPVIPKDAKSNALLAVCKDFHVNSKEIFQLALSKNREMMLPEIASAFLAEFNQQKGIVEATVTAATELDAEALNTVTAFVKKQTGAQNVELIVKKDPSIIGGVIIRFKDRIYDTSIHNQINKLKKELNIA
jgi:F-type H+-transporting ATPase subunit delta